MTGLAVVPPMAPDPALEACPLEVTGQVAASQPDGSFVTDGDSSAVVATRDIRLRSARSSHHSKCLQGRRRIGRYGACCDIACAPHPLLAAPLAA
jgi:hypothetical protein